MTEQNYKTLLAEKDQIIAQLSQALAPFAHVAKRFPVNPNQLREGRLQQAVIWSATEYCDAVDELISFEITVQNIRDAAKTLEDVGGCQ